MELRQRHATNLLSIHPAFLWLLIAMAAFVPRLLNLGDFVTHDEAAFWLQRSETFLRALREGDFAATAISTHPGVTTMWLGSAGILLRESLATLNLWQVESFADNLTLLRLPVVLMHSCCILIGYHMLQRLFSQSIAVLAALFWALDPFIIGYSRLLHVDALAGSFATLSLLAACVFCFRSPTWGYLLISALTAGLAILSKSPLIVLIPVIIVAGWVATQRVQDLPFRRVPMLLTWLAVLAATIVLGWPALWSDPQQALHNIRVGVEVEGGNPHATGNFFLGREDLAPGWQFYPTALALRLTPLTMLGLGALGVALLWRRSPWLAEQFDWRVLAICALFVLLMIAGLSWFPKKFNRYLVPVFPALTILAAVGWVALIGLLGIWKPRMLRMGTSMLGILALVNCFSWFPYYLTAYNQLLGGAQTGTATFQSGWGEGMEQVANWLNRQPDITGVQVASTRTETLQPYLRGGVQALTPGEQLSEQVGYVVVYLRDAQTRPVTPFDRFFVHQEPVHTVTINDVPYAWIYQVAPVVAHRRPAVFNDAIRLRGFALENSVNNDEQHLQLFWSQLTQVNQDYALFIHLISDSGERYQVDLPYPAQAFYERRFVTTSVPINAFGALPFGQYRMEIGLYDPSNGTRATLEAPAVLSAATASSNALLLTTVRVRSGQLAVGE
jgi:hypothetical protein